MITHALKRSTYAQNTFLPIALAFHSIVDSTKLLSAQHRPFLNPFWISPRTLVDSRTSVNLAFRTLEKTPHKEMTTVRGR